MRLAVRPSYPLHLYPQSSAVTPLLLFALLYRQTRPRKSIRRENVIFLQGNFHLLKQRLAELFLVCPYQVFWLYRPYHHFVTVIATLHTQASAPVFKTKPKQQPKGCGPQFPITVLKGKCLLNTQKKTDKQASTLPPINRNRQPCMESKKADFLARAKGIPQLWNEVDFLKMGVSLWISKGLLLKWKMQRKVERCVCSERKAKLLLLLSSFFFKIKILSQKLPEVVSSYHSDDVLAGHQLFGKYCVAWAYPLHLLQNVPGPRQHLAS